MKFSEVILNDALSFSMEFGKNWLKPINDRLSKVHENLNYDDLSSINVLCKQINEFAHLNIYQNTNNKNLVFKNYNDFLELMNKENVWINNENMKRLYNQSCYYASK